MIAPIEKLYCCLLIAQMNALPVISITVIEVIGEQCIRNIEFSVPSASKVCLSDCALAMIQIIVEFQQCFF